MSDRSEQPFRFGSSERLGRVFRDEWDDALVQNALDAGLVSEAQIAEARRLRDQMNDPMPVTSLMLAQGWLTDEALDRLQAEDARQRFGRGDTTEPPALPADAVPSASDPERQFGEFILVSRLGGGVAGEVWKAWERHLGRWVAVKVSTLAIDSATARDRFKREALATARLAHPQIVPVFHVGNARGKPFLVMPFIDGQALDQIEPTTLPVRRVLEIVRAAAAAVEHAHRHGIVHRDLKPGNIMIDRTGGVFILDFGLAYLKEDASSRLTRPGEVMGTASYMAPEQARGDANAADPSVDVHGLGATLYYLLTGRPPFIGPSVQAVVNHVLTDTPEPPRRRRPDLDARVEAVVMKALEKDPRHRYPTASALADDLQRILDGQTVRASKWRPTLKVKIAGMLAAIAVAAAASIVVTRYRAPRDGGVLSISDFRNAGLHLNGMAAVAGRALRLTPSQILARGSAFFAEPFPVRRSTRFEIEFTFRVHSGDMGADGLALLWQNSPREGAALGGTGQGMGYSAIAPSVAIEFDTFSNQGEPGDHHVAVVLGGVVERHHLAAGLPFKINDGAVHHVWVTQDGASKALDIFVSSDDVRPAKPTLSDTVDLGAMVGQRAFIGFSASTGDHFNAHDILSLKVRYSY